MKLTIAAFTRSSPVSASLGGDDFPVKLLWEYL